MKKFLLNLVLLTAVFGVGMSTQTNDVQAATNNSTVTNQLSQKLLTGNRLQNKTVNVYLNADLPTGVKLDAQKAVQNWNNSTNKLTFKFVSDINVANIVFITGEISNFQNARTFYDQTTPNGSHYYINKVFIKMNNLLIDSDQQTNFGVQVAEHEIGHSMGLADITDPDMKNMTIMWYRDPVTGITQNDINVVNNLYR